MESDIFEERENFKPFEYPQFQKYVDAINQSYWLVNEFNFDSDIQDFRITLTEAERSVIKKTMLSISQVEVSVKNFYGIVFAQKFPKPEIQAMASTFSESEVRHENAYSRLLELLGLNDDFQTINEIPALRDRVKYLKKYKDYQNATKHENFLKALILFSIYIEGVSLMSQFLIMQSFKKHRNQLIGISNVVEATSKEEQLHSQGAFEAINIIRKEQPELFTDELETLITNQTKKAFTAELKVLDWIFEEGELDFLPKADVVEFLKNRFNLCLGSIGFEQNFEVDDTLQEKTEWFELALVSDRSNDFFNTKSTSYTKANKSFDETDLF